MFGNEHVDFSGDIQKGIRKAREEERSRQANQAHAAVGGFVLGFLAVWSIRGLKRLFSNPKARYVMLCIVVFVAVLLIGGSGNMAALAAVAATLAVVFAFVVPRWKLINRFGYVPKKADRPEQPTGGKAGALPLVLGTVIVGFALSLALRPLGNALVNIGNEGFLQQNINPLVLYGVSFVLGFLLTLIGVKIFNRRRG